MIRGVFQAVETDRAVERGDPLGDERSSTSVESPARHGIRPSTTSMAAVPTSDTACRPTHRHRTTRSGDLAAADGY
ncbi:hypothetical protein BRD06_07065 [Halobacteriales archaeon QS_9_67_15]|nr:MAG: hypothetical protein BRD06_07065 [Halobacteriales archaeon QS_9_67_15]